MISYILDVTLVPSVERVGAVDFSIRIAESLSFSDIFWSCMPKTNGINTFISFNSSVGIKILHKGS